MNIEIIETNTEKIKTAKVCLDFINGQCNGIHKRTISIDFCCSDGKYTSDDYKLIDKIVSIIDEHEKDIIKEAEADIKNEANE